MKQFWTIFRFEFGKYVNKKTYKVMTVLFVAIILIAMSWPRLSGLFSSGDGAQEGQEQTEALHIAVAAGADWPASEAVAILAAQLPMYQWEETSVAEEALREAITEGAYSGGLWMEDALQYRYYVESEGMNDVTGLMIGQVLSDAYKEIGRASYRERV